MLRKISHLGRLSFEGSDGKVAGYLVVRADLDEKGPVAAEGADDAAGVDDGSARLTDWLHSGIVAGVVGAVGLGGVAAGDDT